MYDVYYATGGGDHIFCGADIWVNNWLQEIPQHLNVKPILLLHRDRPRTETGSKIPIEHYWYNENRDKFRELLNGARRIHILHGYYRPHPLIENNKDRLYSYTAHMSLRETMQIPLDELKMLMHHGANQRWEDQILEWSEKVIWIGVNKASIHDRRSDIIDIPNYYEFKQFRPLIDNNVIGYAARMETRKNPHYLDGLPSIMFTNPKDVVQWRKYEDYDFEKTKIMRYVPESLDKFLGSPNWGISHSCFKNEPFGYSIFQAVDWGKLPILHKDWCVDCDYPFRAETREEFRIVYEDLIKMDYDVKRKEFDKLREYLYKKYGDKKTWIEQYLSVYNEN